MSSYENKWRNFMPASPHPATLAKRLSGLHLIDGKLVPAQSGKTFPVLNPATGETCAEAAFGDAADVDRAVQTAAKAQKDWAKRPASGARQTDRRESEVLLAGTCRGTRTTDDAGDRQGDSGTDGRVGIIMVLADSTAFLMAGWGVGTERRNRSLPAGYAGCSRSANPWASSARSSPGTCRCC